MPLRRLVLSALILGLGVGTSSAATIELSGKVKEQNGYGLAGVTVSLARSGQSMTTIKGGAWSLSGEPAGISSRARQGKALTPNLRLENGHLLLDFQGHDLMGRRQGASEVASAMLPAGASGRTLTDSVTLDTLLFSWKSVVVARQPLTSFSQSGLSRTIDTTGFWVMPVVPGPSGVAPTHRLSDAQYAVASAKGRMVRVPAQNRSFWMGLVDSQQVYDAASLPRHIVSLSYDYWMDAKETSLSDYCAVLNWAIEQKRAEIEVTNATTGRRFVKSIGSNAQYLNIIVPIGGQNSTFQIDWSSTLGLYKVSGQNLPVIDATWYAAAFYANMRSLREGLEPVYDSLTWESDWSKNGYRLATEAEWEFAARAGTSTRYTWGDTWTQSDADFCCNTGTSLWPVGTRAPNRYGLYDMIGNVGETTNDWFAPYTDQALIDPVGASNGTDKVGKTSGANAWNSSPAQRYKDSKTDPTGFRFVLPVH